TLLQARSTLFPYTTLFRSTVPFLKVCKQYRAFLSRSRLAHDLATFDGLLLALRHAGMTIRLEVTDRKRAIMVHMRVKRQHQRWRSEEHTSELQSRGHLVCR